MKPAYAVIGAGSGGQAMAAHLTLLGCQVSLYDIDLRKMNLLRQCGHITVTGKIEGDARIAEFADSLEDAVKGKDVILVATTTDQHAQLAGELLPLLDESQMVVLCPGQTGGAIVVHNIFHAGGKSMIVAEMQDLIYTCRSGRAGQVTVTALKKRMDIAVYHKADYAAVIDQLGGVYPQLRQSPSVLHTGFDNMGAILHPAPVLLNAGRVECGESFLYYREGITPSVAAVLEQMDRERAEVGRAYGVEVTSLAQWQENAYGAEGGSLYEKFQNNSSYAEVRSAETLKNRYITEDVPCGLVPLAAFGSLAGVRTPAIDSVIELAGCLLRRDFRAEGRNLKSLGLEGMSVGEIIKMYL